MLVSLAIAMVVIGLLSAVVALCTRAPRPERALVVGIVLYGLAIVSTGALGLGLLSVEAGADLVAGVISGLATVVAGALIGGWLTQRAGRRTKEAA